MGCPHYIGIRVPELAEAIRLSAGRRFLLLQRPLQNRPTHRDNGCPLQPELNIEVHVSHKSIEGNRVATGGKVQAGRESWAVNCLSAAA